jgi:hypothetical protein
MEFILLDYCFFLSVLLMLPILIPSILKGPIPTFDEIMPGVLSDVEKSSAFLCVPRSQWIHQPCWVHHCMNIWPDRARYLRAVPCSLRQEALHVH